MVVRANFHIALTAFAERSVSLAEELPERDNAIDRLNRGMLEDLREYLGDEESYEWAMRADAPTTCAASSSAAEAAAAPRS